MVNHQFCSSRMRRNLLKPLEMGLKERKHFFAQQVVNFVRFLPYEAIEAANGSRFKSN